MTAIRHISGIRNAEKIEVKVTVTGADPDGVAQSERCVTEMQRRGLEGAGVHGIVIEKVKVPDLEDTRAATEAALKKP